MTLLFTNEKRGYSWHNTERYYLVSKEEYADLMEKYKDHPNRIVREIFGDKVEMDNFLQVFKDVDISCHPQTIVSDGFATYGGRTFKARGIEVKHRSGTNSMDYSSYDYYFTEDTIEQNKVEKVENWWV